MPAPRKTENEKQNLAAPRVSLDSVLEFSRMSGDTGHGVHLCAWHAGPAGVCTQQRVRRLPSTITTLGSERTNEVTEAAQGTGTAWPLFGGHPSAGVLRFCSVPYCWERCVLACSSEGLTLPS